MFGVLSTGIGRGWLLPAIKAYVRTAILKKAQGSGLPQIKHDAFGRNPMPHDCQPALQKRTDAAAPLSEHESAICSALIYTAEDLRNAVALAVEVERQRHEPYPRDWE